MLFVLFGVVAVFWNLENFFDYRNGGRLTKSRFYAKCSGVAKEVLRIADRCGQIPDILAVAEVENSFVLAQLRNSSLLRKAGYGLVHYDSPDHRGMDCGLLYRKDRLRKLSSKPCHIYDKDGRIMPTRDILLASFLLPDGRRLDVLVNHHPSKFGGKSSAGRDAALERMVELRDSLSAYGGIFLSIGDFNDTPGYCPRGLKDLAEPLARSGRGTLRFNGRWEVIDRCFVADSLNAGMEIVEDDVLLVKDRSHGGKKPRRTFSGPVYLGGLSDHLPVVVAF